MSANSAVTVFRSPSSAPASACSGVTRIRSSGARADLTELGGWLERAVPHPSQNLAPARFNVPHEMHRASIGVPHPSQNLAVSRFSAPHFEQRICQLRGAAGRPLDDAAVSRDPTFSATRELTLQLDKRNAFLWTSGYVPSLLTYPGREVPTPLTMQYGSTNPSLFM
jgi:hypothetical protein